jgi:hypothetical protein
MMDFDYFSLGLNFTSTQTYGLSTLLYSILLCSTLEIPIKRAMLSGEGRTSSSAWKIDVVNFFVTCRQKLRQKFRTCWIPRVP